MPARVEITYGGGKSALLNAWLDRLAATQFRGAEYVFLWSFSANASAPDVERTSAAFLRAALRHFGDEDFDGAPSRELWDRLVKLVQSRRSLLVLDGLEVLQDARSKPLGRLLDPDVGC